MVHTTPIHQSPKTDVLSKTFLEIILPLLFNTTNKLQSINTLEVLSSVFSAPLSFI